jgi:hypothetical protein
MPYGYGKKTRTGYKPQLVSPVLTCDLQVQSALKISCQQSNLFMLNKQLVDRIHALFYTFNPTYKVMATITIYL